MDTSEIEIASPHNYERSSSGRASVHKLYFPCLSGLRALAAFTVVFTHVERYRQLSGRQAILGYSFNSFIGGLAVTFFFVLSGFLISSLLFREKARHGTIRVRKFLKRRVLRIWPLYYAVLAGGYGVSIFLFKETSQNPLENGILLNLFLLPNIAFAFDKIPDILIQIWSIGTEEQFYLLWPFVIRDLPYRRMMRVFIGVIVLWIMVRFIAHRVDGGDDWLNIILFRTRIDCMAIGSVFALLVFNKARLQGWKARLYGLAMNTWAGWAGFLLFGAMLYISWRYGVSLYQGYALLSGLLIIRVIHKPVRFLEGSLLKYLGKISFGIYLLHHFIIYFLYRVLIDRGAVPLSWDSGNSPWGDIGIFLLTGVLSVAAAALSYELFESRFLKRKF